MKIPSIYLLIVSLVILSLVLSGCQDSKQSLLKWAQKNSFRNKRTASKLNPLLAPQGNKQTACPVGSKLKIIQATGVSRCVPDKPHDPNTVEQYFPNGKIKSRLLHRGEALKASRWYQSGQIQEEVNYLHSEKHGPFTQWHPNGRLAVQGEYISSKKHGHFVYSNKDGVKIKEGKYRAGQKIGVWTRYHPRGSVKSYETWQNGALEGNMKTFHENGGLSEHGAYVAGHPFGRWFGYHQNGFLRYEGNFLDGKKHGSWIEYSQAGEVTERRWFKRGELGKPTTLTGTVPFKGGDILGAKPPEFKQRRRGLAPRTRPLKNKKGSGWVSM